MNSEVTTLGAVPGTPAGHLQLHLYAAAAHLSLWLKQADENVEPERRGSDDNRFVHDYAAEWSSRVSVPAHISLTAAIHRVLTSWEESVESHLPLRALGPELGSHQRRLAIALAGWPEEDSRFADLFAACQSTGARRPTIETIGRILRYQGFPLDDGWTICRPLVASGMLDIDNPDAPRAEQSLRPSPAVWDALRGELPASPFPGCRFLDRDACPRLEDLPHDDQVLARIDRLPLLIRGRRAEVIVLRHTPGMDGETISAAIARRLDRSLFAVAAPAGATPHRSVGIVCSLANAMPSFAADLAPGETIDVPALPGYDGPIVMALGAEGGIRPPRHATAITIDLPFPDPHLRERHWRAALEGTQVEGLSEIRDRFQVPDGFIRVMAKSASAQSALDGHSRIGVADVRRAGRLLNRQTLDTLAQWLDARGTWADLVTAATTSSSLEELQHRCLQRERLAAEIGPACQRSVGRGVRALFAGASGTGKTMAARILAAELQMDLFRVDLSAIVSKFVGETEKNLHQVLARAEALDVVLLIDEGDALLGRRSESRSATDRWANLETNFLLQRLESYQGIAVVTTNFSENIDPAFQRRMDVVVPFFMPHADERRRIWSLHLPAAHDVEADWLDRVVRRCALTGGQIRNAVLQAASLALQDERRIDRSHLQTALLREYQKAGASYPLWGDGTYRRRGRGGVAELAAALRSR